MTLTLRTNLADYPSTLALKEGRVSSDVVTLDFQGPKSASSGFKDMIRRNAYQAGELAIVTYLQARCYGKPYVMLPFPVSGRTQHHCIAYNKELNTLGPKDIESRKVGVRTYAQTTGLWVRGILQHDYGVDLDQVEWLTVTGGHLAEYGDPANCTRLPAGADLAQMLLDGEIAAALDACPTAVLQFHGDETPQQCAAPGRPFLKAVRMKPGVDLLDLARSVPTAQALLLDAHVEGYGGGGKVFDWSLIAQDAGLPVVLSGGLHSGNVADGVRAVRPWAVDVSSGIEASRGVKSPALMHAFCEAVRQADALVKLSPHPAA